jgi:enoyl-CoA hydratase/carnithine racemase
MLTGNFMSSAEASALGFVSRVVERDMLMGTALELARNMNGKNPAGLRLTKEAININLDICGLEQALGVENRNQALIYAELFKDHS